MAVHRHHPSFTHPPEQYAALYGSYVRRLAHPVRSCVLPVDTSGQAPASRSQSASVRLLQPTVQADNLTGWISEMRLACSPWLCLYGLSRVSPRYAIYAVHASVAEIVVYVALQVKQQVRVYQVVLQTTAGQDVPTPLQRYVSPFPTRLVKNTWPSPKRSAWPCTCCALVSCGSRMTPPTSMMGDIEHDG
jgi:hypothetical protein